MFLSVYLISDWYCVSQPNIKESRKNSPDSFIVKFLWLVEKQNYSWFEFLKWTVHEHFFLYRLIGTEYGTEMKMYVILTTKSQQAFNLSCTFCIEKTRIPRYRNIQVHEWNPSAISTRFQIVCVSVRNAFNYRLSGVPILCEATDNIVPSWVIIVIVLPSMSYACPACVQTVESVGV